MCCLYGYCDSCGNPLMIREDVENLCVVCFMRRLDVVRENSEAISGGINIEVGNIG